MASKFCRLTRAICFATVTIALFGCLTVPSTSAGGPPVDIGGNRNSVHFEVTVNTGPNGISFEIRVQRSSPGLPGSPSQPGTPGQPASGNTGASPSSNIVKSWYDPSTSTYYSQTSTGLTFYVEQVNIGTDTISGSAWYKQGLAQHPNSIPWFYGTNGSFQGVVWIPNTPGNASVVVALAGGQPPAGNANSTNPGDVALDLLAHVGLPNIQLHANPGKGLVALPGWFWVEGYDGSTFGASRTVTVPPAVGANVPITVVPANDPRRQATSFTVSISVWPTRYTWSFGDGGGLVTNSLGRAYPAQSDIQHTYEFSSLNTSEGFPVDLTVDFAASFSVNGGGAQGLPGIQRTYSSTYAVQEIQSVLTSR